MLVAEHVCPVQNYLGESPVWQPDEQALYWVDIHRSRVYRWQPDTESLDVSETDVAITCLRPRAQGGWVAATAGGFAFWDGKHPKTEPIVHPEADLPHMIFNDGAVDCSGRFWAGTANTVEQGPSSRDGSLYRLDADLTCSRADTGFTISNGIGWSPDSRTMYFTDTLRGMIYMYDFDQASGAIENRRSFVRIPEQDGYPDGLAVDSEGCIWSALWGGWKVACFDPEARQIEEVRLPVSNVSCCAFGGADLRDLYITTAQEDLKAKDMVRQPLAGDLFRVRVPVRGLKLQPFAA
jgi:sugar lactone lactonase YvrE